MSERHRHTCACCGCTFVCDFGCESADRTPVYCDTCSQADHQPCASGQTVAWLIERNDVHLCYSQDGASCHKWVTFTDPAAWRFETQAAAETIIRERDLLHCRAVSHGWADQTKETAR